MVGTRQMLTVYLILASICLQGILLQQPGTGEQRKPFFERFRRLEEQLRRFQEVTLVRLQEIARNRSVSPDTDAQLDRLRGRQEALESAANETQAATWQELGRLAAQLRKLQRKAGRQEARLAALQEAWQDSAAGVQRREALLADLARDVAGQREASRAARAAQLSLQRALEGVQDALRSRGSKLGHVEQQLSSPGPHGARPPARPPAAHLLGQAAQGKGPGAAAGQSPTLRKLQAKRRQRARLQQEGSRLVALSRDHGPRSAVPTARALPLPEPESGADATSLLGLQSLQQPASVQGRAPEGPLQGLRQPGAVCNVGSMLVFPNASTENFAVFQPGPSTSLLELSICSWVRTPAGYLGTILSYATEENDNKLVLHGRDVAPRSAIHFVIGDPAFRELPVGRALDGRWHHLCAIWSSIQGRYWFYVDRRLVSMGSGFQRGYEIPPGGSLLLGQEQDVLGGGFEPSEAFVGSLAGFAMWGRALSPGEVSGLAIGSGLPRGPLLTLADVSALHGSVRKVDCTCLEHCL